MLVKQLKFRRTNDKGGFQWPARSVSVGTGLLISADCGKSKPS
jgi:hypothetical protein